MVKSRWITWTKILIWIVFAIGMAGGTAAAIKLKDFRILLNIGALIITCLFILSLILHFKPKKWVVSFILGFVLANILLRFNTLFEGIAELKHAGLPLSYATAYVFWLLYDFVLLFVGYKALRSFRRD